MNTMDGVGLLDMHSLTKELADIFTEDSENERTFDGFSDSEINDLCNENLSIGDGIDKKPEPISKKEENSSKLRGQSFQLRIALRLRPSNSHSTEEDEVESENYDRTSKNTENTQMKTPKTLRRVKFEEDNVLEKPSWPDESGSGSEDAVLGSFLAERDQNIKANKAMLAQLMADLQKMPGGAGFLKKGANKKPKERGSRPPRSSMTEAESRRNPVRTSRRQTRSMGTCENSSPPKEELELSLEEQLLEVSFYSDIDSVRRAPQRRSAPRPSQSKLHIVRPVEEITEDELQLVAENMTDKVYNSVTGSTCHQCRQKTVDTKTVCRSKDCRGIQGQFCGPCLRNRYGEDVRKALLDPKWRCPPCRSICNCSFCRQRDGRCPTGILLPLAQYHGFSDVHSYLSSLHNKLKSGEEDA